MQVVDQIPPDRRKSKHLDLYLKIMEVEQGTTLLLRGGEDFDSNPEALRVSMKAWLKRNGISVATAVIDNDVYVKVVEKNGADHV